VRSRAISAAGDPAANSGVGVPSAIAVHAAPSGSPDHPGGD
jgi:hypothetical protein